MPENEAVRTGRGEVFKLRIESLDYTAPAILDAGGLSEAAAGPCGVCITGGGAVMSEAAATVTPTVKK